MKSRNERNTPVKLSAPMKNRLVEINDAATARERAIGTARNRTDAALERRGLIQRVEIPWSENVAIILTPEGAKEALHLHGEEEAEEIVIAHQGAVRGVAFGHADNPTARAAISTLTNAGFAPATVNGEFDPTPGDGTTGFYTEVRYADTPDEIVYVHDVLDGKLTWRRDADSKLSDYAKALADAGWSIPTGTARVVRALPRP